MKTRTFIALMGILAISASFTFSSKKSTTVKRNPVAANSQTIDQGFVGEEVKK
jgi:hypothetical protein